MTWLVEETGVDYSADFVDYSADFVDYSAAVEYLNERAAEYEQTDGCVVEYGMASSGNYAAVKVTQADGSVVWIAVERDDEDEQDRPAEDDDYIADARGGYDVSHAGKFLGTFASQRRAEAALYLARLRSSYWPNIWMVNDHGNVTLCVFDSHVLRFTETSYV